MLILYFRIPIRVNCSAANEKWLDALRHRIVTAGAWPRSKVGAMSLLSPVKTLLVVDDEISNLESLERIFTRWSRGTPGPGEAERALRGPGGGGRLRAGSGSRPASADHPRWQRGARPAAQAHRRRPYRPHDARHVGAGSAEGGAQISPETEVILMTAYGTIEDRRPSDEGWRVRLHRQPLKRAHILRVVGKALERQSLVAENRALRSQLAAVRSVPSSGSLAMRPHAGCADPGCALTQATVLLLGESGTGKGAARASPARTVPAAGRSFVPVNCAALPETILEGELFG